MERQGGDFGALGLNLYSILTLAWLPIILEHETLIIAALHNC